MLRDAVSSNELQALPPTGYIHGRSPSSAVIRLALDFIQFFASKEADFQHKPASEKLCKTPAQGGPDRSQKLVRNKGQGGIVRNIFKVQGRICFALFRSSSLESKYWVTG